MSSHPGSTLKDAVYLAEYLYKNHMRPEQVQDFYPTPGTVSTCMFYTGLDPYTLKPVFVEKTPEGKALQRALLQYYEPRNAEKVVKALRMTHREDLIPLLVPAEGRRAVQRSARRADSPEVTIHNDGTYTVRPNQKGKGKPAHGPNRTAAPAGRQPSPGARFAPHSAPGHKPKRINRKRIHRGKLEQRKSDPEKESWPAAAAAVAGRCGRTGPEPCRLWYLGCGAGRQCRRGAQPFLYGSQRGCPVRDALHRRGAGAERAGGM